VEFVWTLIVISWGWKSLWTSSSFELGTWFSLCQECQERNMRSNICILGTRFREMMKKFSNF
jgi:hypothetical protein